MNKIKMLGRYKTKARVGAIDIGSNAVRAIALEFNNKNVKEIYSKRVPFRLREIHSEKSISEKKANELVENLMEFKDDFKSMNVQLLRACATSAMRESRNKVSVLKKIKEQSQFDIECIDGREEAYLVYLAIKYFHSFCSDCVLVDLGGGSLEIAVFSNYKMQDFVSLELGTLKILEHIENPHYVEDIIGSQFNKDKKFNTDILSNVKEGCPFFFTGGNARAVLKILGNSAAEDDVFAEIEKKQLGKLFESLRGLSPEKRMSQFKISRNRADVIFPAVAVFYELMNYFDSSVAQIPDLGLKHGIAISKLFSENF